MITFRGLDVLTFVVFQNALHTSSPEVQLAPVDSMRVIQTHVSLQFPHVLACFYFSAKELEEILAGLQASKVTSKLSSRFGSCT